MLLHPERKPLAKVAPAGQANVKSSSLMCVATCEHAMWSLKASRNERIAGPLLLQTSHQMDKIEIIISFASNSGSLSLAGDHVNALSADIPD